MGAPSRDELVEHLVATRICGDVATPRENNLRNARLCSEREPGYTFGLRFDGRWSYADVVALMADRAGISPDLRFTEGQDRIDPERCADRLDDMAERITKAARDRARVVVATGHPGCLLPVHLAVAAQLRDAGATVLEAGQDGTFVEHGRLLAVRTIAGVAMVGRHAGLNHTHSPAPMRMILDALAAAGEAPPDLAVADHGWAGAAGQAGIEAVGFADCNDPALFVGEAEGRVAVTVPLDDGIAPHLYAPLTAHLLRHLR